jgi:hypothetical protein
VVAEVEFLSELRKPLASLHAASLEDGGHAYTSPRKR